MFTRTRSAKVHFIGIGGIGMSGIAELLHRLGHRVSGSDQKEGDRVVMLKKLGAKIQIGHSREWIQKCKPDVVVYSSAIKKDNEEFSFCREEQIPLIRRAEMLAELMKFKRGVAIAGSHGKTTTTAMLSLLLEKFDPTVVIGGVFNPIGSNVFLGQGDILLAEADESDGSFLRLSPEVVAITNVDKEHLNYFGSYAALQRAFVEFLDRLPFYGRAYLCSDSATLRDLAPHINKSRKWYGFKEKYKPDVLIRKKEAGSFSLFKKEDGYKVPTFEGKLSVPGEHNILNATAATLIALYLGATVEDVQQGLIDFRGVRRRFEYKGNWGDHEIIEDYAHHPTEIQATIRAAIERYGEERPPVIIFQPHRFTRSKTLWKDFKTCFESAKHVLVLPTYAASETKEEWIKDFNSKKFSKNIEAPSEYCPTIESAIKSLAKKEKSASINTKSPILVLGAGDVYNVVPELLKGHEDEDQNISSTI